MLNQGDACPLGDGVIYVARAGQSLTERLRAAIQAKPDHFHPQHDTAGDAAAEPELYLNATRDTRYAHERHPVFDHVVTLFTQQWVGIRASAGSLPGAKLAIGKAAQMGPSQVRELLQILEDLKVHTVLVHGLSDGVIRAVHAIRIARPELRICAIWHGALAAWSLDEERGMAQRLFELATEGVFDSISVMKRGAHVLHPKAVPYLVPNFPPTVSLRRLRPAGSSEKRTALFGSWNNTWKNMYANVAGAALSRSIDEVISYSDVDGHLVDSSKIRRAHYRNRSHHFALLANVDLVLNATVVDCHPMVEMEALAVGTPVLRGPLDLDFGQETAFEKLLTVQSPHNIAEIVETIDRISSVPADEMADIIADYKQLVMTTAIGRYADFLKS